MNKLTTAFLLLILISISTPVMAADSDGAFLSVGDISCNDWVRNINFKPKIAREYKIWVSGYVTAYNMHTENVFHFGKTKKIAFTYTEVTIYCANNPHLKVSRALYNIGAKYWEERMVEAPKK